MSYTPAGIEQIPLASEEPLLVDPGDSDQAVLDYLGINRDSYRYVGQGNIYSAEAHIRVIRSEGFVNCSAFILRNLLDGSDTFAHFWPSVTAP